MRHTLHVQATSRVTVAHGYRRRSQTVGQWQEEIEKAAAGPQPATTVSGVPIDPLYTPENLDGFDYDTDLGYPGQYPFTRGVHATMYRGRLWTMRQFAGFGTAAADERAIQVPARQGPDRAEHRVRPADADGPRQRRSALAGRSRPARRGRRHDRRHAAAVRRHRPRQGLGVDDDQRAGRRSSWRSTWPTPRTGRRLAASCAARSRTTSSRSFTPRTRFVFPPEPSVRLVIDVIEFCTAARAAVEPGVDQRLPHPRGRLDGRAGAGLHAGRRLPLRRRSAWRAAWTSTSSPRGSASSSTRTTTCSRKSPSTGPPACCGPNALRNHYGAKNENSWKLRFHAQTAGCSLQDKQPRGEPDPRRLPGAGRGAGRLPVAAHQQHGRNAGPAVGTRRHAGPAHAAGAGPRNGRDQHGRSARRQLLRRNAHAADAAGSPRLLRAHRASWAA